MNRRAALGLLLGAAAAAPFAAAGCGAAPRAAAVPPPFASLPRGFEVHLRVDLRAWAGHPAFGPALRRQVEEDPDLPNAAPLAAFRNAYRVDLRDPLAGRTDAFEIGLPPDFLDGILRTHRPGMLPRMPDLMRSRAVLACYGAYNPRRVASQLRTLRFNSVGWHDGLRIWGAMNGPRIVVEPHRLWIAGDEEALRRLLDVAEGRRLASEAGAAFVGGLAMADRSPVCASASFGWGSRTYLGRIAGRGPIAQQQEFAGLEGPWAALRGAASAVVAMDPAEPLLRMEADYTGRPPDPEATARGLEAFAAAFPLPIGGLDERRNPIEARARFEAEGQRLSGTLAWTPGSAGRVGLRDLLMALGMAR